ncbi:hypothetical protein [Aliiroseovarius sp. S253]|uniref:hypothetical protein n=1 Tax=Aliiroseovarius sp. S253 TaxID=3415133 RepID=UPI003C7B1EDF
MNTDLVKLAQEVEAALTLDGDLVERVIAQLFEVLGDQRIEPKHLDSTDQILALIAAIRPGWAMSMKGAAHLPNGHWSCSLRKSDLRDNDEYLGIGRGPTLPHSLLAALLKALAQAS